jgi:hypothetical protein
MVSLICFPISSVYTSSSWMSRVFKPDLYLGLPFTGYVTSWQSLNNFLMWRWGTELMLNLLRSHIYVYSELVFPLIGNWKITDIVLNILGNYIQIENEFKVYMCKTLVHTSNQNFYKVNTNNMLVSIVCRSTILLPYYRWWCLPQTKSSLWIFPYQSPLWLFPYNWKITKNS